ncbi:MAG: hypothetical protein Fur006_63960 [Coleofasciculaceae cyanobacterium]
MTLIALLTLVTTVTISDFSFIQTPKSQIPNSRVLAQTPDAQKAEADRLLKQGVEQYRTSQFDAAIQSWQQALTLFREIKNRKAEGWVLNNLGLVYRDLGQYTKSIEYLEQSLALAREINDRQQEGTCLGNLGNAYAALGKYDKAMELYEQSLALARETQNRLGEGKVLGNLGNAYEFLGNYPKAIEYLQQRLEIALEIKDRRGEAAARGNLGRIYRNLGEYTKAFEYLQQWLAIAREIKDRKSEGRAVSNLGLLYHSFGDYTKAIDYHQQWLAIAREVKDREGEQIANSNLGIAYQALNEYAKAIEYTQQSLAIAREIKDREGEGKTLGNLGLAYRYLGDYPKAIEYIQQSLAIAREIKSRKSEGTNLGNLGIAYYSLRDYAKAIDYAQQWLAIAREIKDLKSESRALNNLGLALYKSGNLTASEKILVEGIKAHESLRSKVGDDDANKVSIFEEQSRTYRNLQTVLIAQNKIDAALEISERGRARAFVELLTRRLSSNQTEPANSTPPTIEQIKQIAASQNSTLVQYSIIYDDFNVQEKQQAYESELYIWVIKPTGEITFHRVDLKPLWQQQNISLDELVQSSRDAIGVRGLSVIGIVSRPETQQKPQANLTERLQQLHQLLIEPIANQLPMDSSDRVIFIPQKELFLAPFPAFQDKEGKYLVEKHTILTAPSIQVLELTRKQQQNRGSRESGIGSGNALVVGNPTMPSVPPYPGEKPQQLPALPGAEQEALAIAPLLNTKAIIGKDATKTAIKQLMPKARIIHLATHGILDDVRGMGSALALAPSQGRFALSPSENNDGLLTAEQILEMKLNAELVVLSACNTGRGRITGDGVIGLSRSLISAGVPSVVVSLWSVPDAPTASLMTNFYQNLQNSPDKAQALRQAMLTTMKQHPNPRDWAAFTLIGEAQ